MFKQRNWVFATYSYFLTPISLQPDGVHLWYFKLRLFVLTKFMFWNIKRLPTTSGCKEIGIKARSLCQENYMTHKVFEVFQTMNQRRRQKCIKDEELFLFKYSS